MSMIRIVSPTQRSMIRRSAATMRSVVDWLLAGDCSTSRAARRHQELFTLEIVTVPGVCPEAYGWYRDDAGSDRWSLALPIRGPEDGGGEHAPMMVRPRALDSGATSSGIYQPAPRKAA